MLEHTHYTVSHDSTAHHVIKLPTLHTLLTLLTLFIFAYLAYLWYYSVSFATHTPHA